MSPRSKTSAKCRRFQSSRRTSGEQGLWHPNQNAGVRLTKHQPRARDKGRDPDKSEGEATIYPLQGSKFYALMSRFPQAKYDPQSKAKCLASEESHPTWHTKRGQTIAGTRSRTPGPASSLPQVSRGPTPGPRTRPQIAWWASCETSLHEPDPRTEQKKISPWGGP